MSGVMPRGTRQLLLPAKPFFIWSSLVAAFALNMLQNLVLWGRAGWTPDLLALVLVFWNVHQPQRVGIGAAFLFGVFMDVHQSSLLGQHALCYAVLSFLAITVHKRLLWFNTLSQALQILPLFLGAHLMQTGLRIAFGNDWPDWTLLWAPLIESALWPLVAVILLMPQRRTPDPDADRPI